MREYCSAPEACCNLTFFTLSTENSSSASWQFSAAGDVYGAPCSATMTSDSVTVRWGNSIPTASQSAGSPDGASASASGSGSGTSQTAGPAPLFSFWPDAVASSSASTSPSSRNWCHQKLAQALNEAMKDSQNDNPNVFASRRTYLERIIAGFLAHACSKECGVAKDLNFNIQDVANLFGYSLSNIYRLRAQARDSINKAEELSSSRQMEESGPVFILNRKMIITIILVLTAVSQASGQDIEEFFRLVFNYAVSDSLVSNIRKEYGEVARHFLDHVDLSSIKCAAQDEIYSGKKPVFTAIDLVSNFIYLSEVQDTASGDAWKAQMDRLKSQGLNIEVSITDCGGGLLSGVKASSPDTTQQFDVFHILWDFGGDLNSVIRSCEGYLKEFIRIETIANKPRYSLRHKLKSLFMADDFPGVSKIHNDIETIHDWVQELLGFSGNDYETSEELIKWLCDEIVKIADNPQYKKLPVKLRPAKAAAETLRERIGKALSFLQILYKNFDKAAAERGLDPELFKIAYRQTALPKDSKEYQELEEKLQELAKASPVPCDKSEIDRIVRMIKEKTPRASSMVENYNSRIRTAINDFRGLSQSMADLLRLYHNSKRATRSAVKDRIGTSPLERLNGDRRNFLEILWDTAESMKAAEAA